MCKYFVFLAVAGLLPDLFVAQRKPIDFLPRPYECGLLREEQFYNLEKTIKPNEFPWMAKLRYNNNSQLYCMATLIHKQYVLSTAVCLSNYKIDAVELGWCATRNCLTVRDFDEVIIHPSVLKGAQDITSRENNLGMIRFKKPIGYTAYIRPICLPSADVNELDFVAQHLSLAGVVILGGHKTKQFALIMGLTKCRDFLSQVNDHFICSNTCDNGSRFRLGTALMAPRIKNGKPDHYFLVGVQAISKTEGCDGVSPDIFVRVDRHLNWITDSIFERETNQAKMRT